MLQQTHAILDQAIETYHPSHVFALFSGGYDSLVTTHVVMSYLKNAKVAHINTGIGIEETRRFVRETCKEYDWHLVEYHAPERYEDIVMRDGFPGPASHRYMYIRLKERCLDALVREHKQSINDRIFLITGVRKQESQRRMGHVQAIIRQKTRVWVAPLLEWSKTDILDYMAKHNLPRNEVVDLLHMSGECLCGSYAQKGELAMIDAFYPAVGCRLRNLESQVRAAGFPWGWEDKPPSWYVQESRGQLSFLPLCTSCDARFVETR